MFGNKEKAKKEITLDDVVPAHPEEYPGRGLRARLDARRETLREIHGHNHSDAIENTDLGMGE